MDNGTTYELALKQTRDTVKKNLNLFSKNAFDISILPGWASLVAELLEDIQLVIVGTNAKIQIVQIKEKFGSLRFYFGKECLTQDQEAAISTLVADAEAKSTKLCAICGDAGVRDSSTGWVSVRCEGHRTEQMLFSTEYDITAFAQHEDAMAKLLKQY